MLHKRTFVPLILGVDGLIGNALWHACKQSCPNVFGTSRKGTYQLPHLDLRRPLLEAIDPAVTHAIIAAATPIIKQCELEPASTAECNLHGPLFLAKEFAKRGIKPILFSTDYVFDGMTGGYREEDAPHPLNQYGRQKAELEASIQQELPDFHVIIRLGKVVPSPKQGLLGEIIDLLLQGKRVRAARDQVFSPVMLDDVAAAVLRLAETNATGLYHLGGPEVWSRFDLAKAIAETLKVDPHLVEPISLDELNEPFKRPKKTDLVSSKIERDTGLLRKQISNIWKK